MEQNDLHGVFAGPVLGLSWYPDDAATHFTFAGAIGFAFDITERLILNFSLETGSTTVFTAEKVEQWPHLGLVLNLGYWAF